jgi:hypothetical protein
MWFQLALEGHVGGGTQNVLVTPTCHTMERKVVGRGQCNVLLQQLQHCHSESTVKCRSDAGSPLMQQQGRLCVAATVLCALMLSPMHREAHHANHICWFMAAS